MISEVKSLHYKIIIYAFKESCQDLVPSENSTFSCKEIRLLIGSISSLDLRMPPNVAVAFQRGTVNSDFSVGNCSLINTLSFIPKLFRLTVLFENKGFGSKFSCKISARAAISAMLDEALAL